ncbi:MAG: hypothetical protein NTZ39_10180 [Methanoregula sp.]|nr:hypothetical protein [Methanoregula sp.]
MKGLTKCIILGIVLVLCVSAVSAFSVSTVSIDPSGDLVPGTPVIVSFKADFADSGTETFPSSDSLQMLTDLESPKWTWTLLLNGVENPRPQAGGKMLELSGWDLSYPSRSIEESVRVTLEGKAPSVTSTSNKTLIKIQEMDSRNNPITSSLVSYTRLVVNTGEVTTLISSRNSDLQTYRAHIEEKAAMDIDTSAAEAKYNEAKQKIDAAQALPSTQFTTALNYLNAAQTSIADGEKLLDKSWAENEVANAQVPINNVDVLIGYFKGNQSTANDARLAPITTKRELAAGYISNANDDIANGNYAQARIKAQDAFAKGNESYNDALDFKKQLESSWNPLAGVGKIFSSSVIIIVVGVIVVVLVIVGVIIYRKRSRWDELG